MSSGSRIETMPKSLASKQAIQSLSVSEGKLNICMNTENNVLCMDTEQLMVVMEEDDMRILHAETEATFH